MKKQVIPFAVVSTLAFAPLSAGAVEYSEVKDQYPAMTSWTEVDWNTYLEENYGSQLEEYDTMNELEADIGEPIDINQLADGNFDQNILDIIERYNMDTSQLAAFLEEYDNKDNIHFVGDLVTALDDGGNAAENGSTNNDVASENNNEVNTSNNSDTMDHAQLEETYLVPLGWTVDEFNQYLSDSYETDLNDYILFEDLEAEVGPLITDDNELELIEEYGLTPEEYEVLLAEYGESPEDYYFLNDLRDSLDYYTSEQPEEATAENSSTNNDKDAASENNNEDNTSNNSDTAEQNEPAEADTMDQAQLEKAYLVPLGWTVDEFNQYLNDNYETDLNDYILFEDLEAEVGPLITDDNELELIEEYGLTPEEYEVLLAEYGESPEDYYFLNDLRDSLDYYTSEQPEEAATEKGGDLPNTATNSLAYILLGAGLISLGGITMRARKRFGDR